MDSCVCNSILAYVDLFLRLYVRGDGLAYARSCLRTWAFTRVRKMLGKGLTQPIFTSFPTVSLLYAIITPLFVNFASKHHCIFLFIFILASKTSLLLIFT